MFSNHTWCIALKQSHIYFPFLLPSPVILRFGRKNYCDSNSIKYR
ncbi:hypothetical protein IFVP177_C1150047 [Vibrio parahaemolyticus]